MKNLPSQNNGSSSLDVVIEALVSVSVTVQIIEGLFGLEILKLNHHVGIDLLGGCHELVHEILLLLDRRALLPQTHVKLVFEVALVVGATVENNGQGLGGIDACASSVECQLADGNADSVESKVTETQNTRAVCHNADFGVGVGPVLQNGPDGLSLLDGNVQGLWASVQGRILQTDVTNGGCVDQGHQLLCVVHEKAVKQVDILVLHRGQVEVSVDIGLARADHSQSTLALCLQAFHGVRY